jgi:nucleotide-binding universal stress UspA family protein
MSDTPWRVLVPVEVLEGETIPDSVVDALARLPVVVLGYHILPEQTPPGQARLQFEDTAQSKLDELASAFEAAGGDVETRLVFTHDEEQTIDRIADETGCEVILLPNPAPDIERLLVPLRGAVDVQRVATFVAALIGDRDISATLFHVADNDEATDAGRSMLDEAVAVLRDRGVSEDRVTTEVVVSESPIQTIATAATDHHAVVMGEDAPSLRSLVFGEVSEQVAAQSLGPVFVVRRRGESA